MTKRPPVDEEDLTKAMAVGLVNVARFKGYVDNN